MYGDWRMRKLATVEGDLNECMSINLNSVTWGEEGTARGMLQKVRFHSPSVNGHHSWVTEVRAEPEVRKGCSAGCKAADWRISTDWAEPRPEQHSAHPLSLTVYQTPSSRNVSR